MIISTIPTLLDSRKGSLTNRVDCMVEHTKNDCKFGFQLAVPTAAVVAAAYKPNVAANIATKLGKTIRLWSEQAIKFVTKQGPKNKIADFIAYMSKHPTRTGVAGLTLAAGLWVLNSMLNYAGNRGRIEQKYEDAAKIEASTRNVILESADAKK